MSDFTHLHVHSYYSLMDGLNSPAELLSAAKDVGQSALAITDHGTLSSHRELQKDAKEAGLKPILGLEAYISPTDRFDRRAVKKRDDNTQAYNHIILLAKDAQGYRNLNSLSEIAWTEGFYSKPRIDADVLESHRDGLIVLSGCLNGLIPKAIERGDMEEAVRLTKWYKNTFEDNFYMEVQEHNPVELNKTLFELADRYGIKPVATGDCHFARQEDKAIEEAMLILSTSPKAAKGATYEGGKQIKDIFERLNYLYPERKMSFEEIDLYIHGRADLQTRFERRGFFRTDIYENTQEIVDKVGDYEFHEKLDLLPKPKTQDPAALLRKRAHEGLKGRGKYNVPGYVERLNEELDIIVNKGFPSYFLIEANTIRWAHQQGIRTGPGRGSGAGSLVNYSLRVTNVDPIEHNLLFFRFLDPNRDDEPDIDTDVEDRRRGEIKDYSQRQYKHVASIATYGTFAGKNSIRDASRVFMVPLGDVNKALKGADFPPNVDFWEKWEELPQAQEFITKYSEAVNLAKYLFGRIKSQGMHAGGLILSNQPINQFAPMQTSTNKQDASAERVPLVALTMEQVADIGFIKYDWLGLKTLSVISDTEKLIKERHHIDVDLDNMPLDDPKIYENLSNGYTKGVFQVEAFTYTNLLIRMGGVKTFDELVASNALVRPGAMDSSAGSDFIERKNGRLKVKYHHPDMESFTADTYGAIIYQEQVMLTMTELAGMTMSTANKVRKIIGKKRDVKEFEQYKAEFIDGASKKVDLEVAEGLWHDFEAHANYSFNKSHAVAYSMLSYWTAWLKEYYPLEYMVSMLKNEGDKDTILEYLMEAKRMGVRIMLPHVNASGLDFEIQKDLKGDYIRFGLSNIKFISTTGARALIKARPFKNYEHFKETVATPGNGLNSRMISALNAIGGAAFDDNPRTGNERENLFEYLSIPAFEAKNLDPKIVAQFRPLEDYSPDEAFVSMGMVKAIKRGPGWARLELVDETGQAGVFTDEHTPIETGNMYVFLISNNRVGKFCTIEDLAEGKTGAFGEFLNRTELWEIDEGLFRVVQFKSRKTKRGSTMADAVFADRNKKLWPAMVFPQMYHKAFGKCKEGAVVRANLELTDDGARYLEKI